MKHGINIINFGDCGDARTLADLARDAENAGWDGFFIWDHVALPWPAPAVDAWIALAAIATQTERIRFGALVTPLPRRRPWKFARETASLDRLAGGRLVVGVGIGALEQEFEHLGEQTDLKQRGAMLDEALEVVTGLWRGEAFSHNGEHYTVHEALFLPTPVQTPRIPIWVGGRWPNKPPFRRAARWDGVFPDVPGGDPNAMLTPDGIREIVAYVTEHRTNDAPFDVTMVGGTPGDDIEKAAEIVAPYAEAGLTWWQEGIHLMRPDLAERSSSSSPLEAMRWRIQQGPPRI
jgi:hypothetical protein